MTLQRFRVAALQMVSAPEVDSNLRRAEALIAEAAAAGAQLVALPEYFCLLGRQDGDKVAVREADGSGPIQQFLAEAARRHGLWLIGGTLPLWCDAPDKVRNSCLVFDDQGQRRARYDKMHLFGFDNGSERFDEARSIQPGTQPVALDSPFGRIGLSVCYDLRFAELYRHYAASGADLLLVPSAFTHTTGAAHWEVLLRARAIENLSYVLAAAQGGTHPSGRQTWGQSIVIDPWGAVLAQQAQGPGVVVADIDAAALAQRRVQLPALQHRLL